MLQGNDDTPKPPAHPRRTPFSYPSVPQHPFWLLSCTSLLRLFIISQTAALRQLHPATPQPPPAPAGPRRGEAQPPAERRVPCCRQRHHGSPAAPSSPRAAYTATAAPPRAARPPSLTAGSYRPPLTASRCPPPPPRLTRHFGAGQDEPARAPTRRKCEHAPPLLLPLPAVSTAGAGRSAGLARMPAGHTPRATPPPRGGSLWEGRARRVSFA